MNNRIFKTDKNILLAEGRRIVSNNDDARFIRKVTLVNLMLNGCKASEICKSCCETARTLTSWMKQVDEQGFEALRPGKHPGRPNKLTLEQKEEIKVAITSDPSNYGLNVWDGPSLSSYIKDKYDISIGVRQCQRLMHKLGFSLIRPQTFPSKDEDNTAEREEFKKKL